MVKKILSHQMLCLSVHERDGQTHLLLEKEPYYRDQDRAPHTETALETLSIKNLAMDSVFLSDLGFKIALALLSEHALNDVRDGIRVRYIYAYQDDGRAVLRMDRYLPGHHPYRPSPHRTVCEKVFLPSLIKEDIFQDKTYHVLAKTVLGHLPLDVAEK
ncbi:hypothetical protein [Micavibrio aeruginosavorus]|uniref:hypothetical protein n=1 Tax=Micavibrio aeruginosavorus TaxID=349221 RepID=UPI003F4AA946